MKRMRKLVLVVLALTVALTMGVATAFAADITVDKVKAGETYDAYQILHYTSSDDAYSYYLTKAEYEGGLGAVLEGAGFQFAQSADKSAYVLQNADQLTADSIVAALKNADLTKAIAHESETATTDGQAVFSGLEQGYYFVTTTTGSLCSLASYDDQELIVDKHDGSSVVKTVQEATASVGQTVHYSVEIKAKKGETIVFTDVLSKGLTLDAQTSLKVTGVEGYTVDTWDTSKGTGSATNIKITFPEAAEDGTYNLTYTATVNSDAIIMDEVNNTAKIKYGNNQKQESEVTTKLYDFTLSKVDGKDNKALEGVKFTVQNAEGKYYDGSSVWTDTATELTTNADGIIEVKGIAAGEYTLTETAALDGYNPLDAPIKVVIAADGKITQDGKAVNGATITVENNQGSVLPSTGGMGTTIFYILGALLVIGCGIVLVARRRMAAK